MNNFDLTSSKWFDKLTSDIANIIDLELEKISIQLDKDNNESMQDRLWYHFDRLQILRSINDNKYICNNDTKKLKDNTIITLKD